MTRNLCMAIAAWVVVAGCAADPAADRTTSTNQTREAPPEHAALPPGAPPATPLTGTDWQLVSLDGKEITPPADRARPYIRFETNDRAHGYAGCNRFTGGYRIDGVEMEFAGMAMTRMACADGMDVEARFIDALGRVSGYDVEGDRLTLLGEDGMPVAILQRRDLL